MYNDCDPCNKDSSQGNQYPVLKTALFYGTKYVSYHVQVGHK